MSFERYFDNTKEMPENPLAKEEVKEEEKEEVKEKEESIENETKEKEQEAESESKQEKTSEQNKEDDKIDKVLKKFGIESPDKSVANMAKSYSEVEKALHRNFQEVSATKKEIAEIKETMAQLVGKLDNQDKEEPEMTKEQKEKTVQELFDLMYDDPLKFADKLYELKLGKKIEQQITDYMEKNNLLEKQEESKKEESKQEIEIGPEEKKWVNYATEFINTKNLSMEQVQRLSPVLDKFLRENPNVVLGDKNPYIVAYDSIMKEVEEPKKEITIDNIDEELKKQIIEEYKKSLEKPPQTINKKGGQTLVTPSEKPKDIKSASKMFRQFLGMEQE